MQSSDSALNLKFSIPTCGGLATFYNLLIWGLYLHERSGGMWGFKEFVTKCDTIN